MNPPPFLSIAINLIHNSRCDPYPPLLRVLNQTLTELNLKKHREKTLIGRICRGFDFLGYHFGPKFVTLARKTIINFVTKASAAL
jgi:hypothetical protein